MGGSESVGLVGLAAGPFRAIVRDCSKRDEHSLRLLLLTPVKVSVGSAGDLVDVTNVRFKASGRHSYSWGTVSGVLEPMTLLPARVCVL